MWEEKLTDDEKVAFIACLYHALNEDYLHLSDAQENIVDDAFHDLDAWMNGGPEKGYAATITGSDRELIWSTTCAFGQNIHAPLDNMSEELWDRAAALFQVLNCDKRPTMP